MKLEKLKITADCLKCRTKMRLYERQSNTMNVDAVNFKKAFLYCPQCNFEVLITVGGGEE